MQYPLISEYVESIRNAEDNFDKLTYLRPVMDDNGDPVMSSGNFAVVFKMTDGNKNYAIKCFTKEQEGRAEAYQQIADELEDIVSSYIASIKFFEKELFVDCKCDENEFPVLLMDWIEGVSMEKYVADNYQDEYAMSMLCYRFCKMAAWLRSQPFAHGDLKPDNIMVRPDGKLTLVDYDGMFVPAMKGQKSPTIGTKNFSHPLRTVDDFDETIDDFALASIALSLKAISLKPTLYDEYCEADKLLFFAEDYWDLSKSKVLKEIQSILYDTDVTKLLSLFIMSLSTKCLSMCSHSLFCTNKPNKIRNISNKEIENDIINLMSTEVSQQELHNAIIDDYGVKYSKDLKKLLQAPITLKGSYSIKEGTQIVSDKAFMYCGLLMSVEIPHSVTIIGDSAFQHCFSLESIVIPDSVTNMKGNPFVNWCGTLKILSPYFCYENGILLNYNHKILIACCSDSKSYNIPNSVIEIGDHAFMNHSSITDINLSDNIKKIGSEAFCGCRSLITANLFNDIEEISDGAFARCENLSSLEIPQSLKSIGDGVFSGCSSLETIKIPYSVMNMAGNPFSDWYGTLEIQSPYFYYENGMLLNSDREIFIAYCSNRSICTIPNSVICIGKGAFEGRRSLTSIEIPESVTSIGDNAFMYCTSLFSINIPDGVTSIGKWTFFNCSSLSEIELPDSITKIGYAAFCGCTSLNPERKNEISERFGNDVFGHTFSTKLLRDITKLIKKH